MGKTEGRIEVTVRRGRRSKRLLDYVKERRWKQKWKEEALDRPVWRTGFGIGKGKGHPCTGRTAQKGSRGIALTFHDHGTRRG